MIEGLKVVTVLPAYHAARTLERTVAEIPHDIVDDIVLVDDASRDDTVAVGEAAGAAHVVHERTSATAATRRRAIARRSRSARTSS